MKILASIVSVSILAIVGCAGTDSVDSTTGDDVEGLKKACGGIAAIQCPKGYECVITATYPDAMGSCKKQKKCVETMLCTLDSHWDSTACACVPNSTCVDTVMCMVNSHWDSKLCKCVPN